MDEDTRRKRAKKRAMIKRKKQRRNRIIASFVAIGVAITCIIILIVSLVNGFGPRAEETTLTLRRNGMVIMEEVETLPSEYDTSDFTNFAREAVNNYTPKEGDRVKLVVADVKDGVTYVKTEYSSPEAYADFTGYKIFQGTVGEAIAAGYKLDSSIKDMDLSIFIVNQNLKLAADTDKIEVYGPTGKDNPVTYMVFTE